MVSVVHTLNFVCWYDEWIVYCKRCRNKQSWTSLMLSGEREENHRSHEAWTPIAESRSEPRIFQKSSAKLGLIVPKSFASKWGFWYAEDCPFKMLSKIISRADGGPVGSQLCSAGVVLLHLREAPLSTYSSQHMHVIASCSEYWCTQDAVLGCDSRAGHSEGTPDEAQ
jgi:hypothetical protein